MEINFGLEGFTMMKLLSSVALMVLLFNPAWSSRGDRSFLFGRCVSDCSVGCQRNTYPGKLPLYLRLFFWDCMDECKYQCMHTVTQVDLKENRPIKQFHGKWPFVRFLGIQEPASVLFSIFNAIGHVVGWRMLRTTVPNNNYDMYPVWKSNYLVCVNAWFWSTVYHSRDLIWTEKLDYFCATSLVIFSIFSCFIRFIGLQNRLSCFITGFLLFSLFCYHVHYLGFVRFDYGYNMKFNVAIGFTNMVCWLTWCFLKYKEQPYVWKCALLNVCLPLLLTLELYDFPPILWTFDAHSLWHLATAPLTYLWYSFIADDAKYQLLRDKSTKSV